MLTSPLPQPTDAVDADATRRSFLKKVAIGGAAVAIGTQVGPLRAFAQEGETDTTEGETTDTTAPGTEGESEGSVELNPDEQRVAYLAGIGLAAATVYRAAVGDEGSDAEASDGEGSEEGGASSSTTSTLPPIEVPSLAEPVVEVLRVFGSHHSQQATAMNGLLATAVATPNPTLVAEVRGALGQAADETAVLAVLRDLEERIAATHLQAIADIEDANDAKLIATALPVAGQHAVVLGLVGSTPASLEELVPEEQTTEGALDEAAYPAEAGSGADTSGQTDDDANAGGGGADPDTDTTEAPGDGTESSGGGAGDGTDTGAGSAADTESEG